MGILSSEDLQDKLREDDWDEGMNLDCNSEFLRCRRGNSSGRDDDIEPIDIDLDERGKPYREGYLKIDLA